MSIPNKLFSETTGKPFEHCSVCDTTLEERMYFVEKAYHRNLGDEKHTVIFEYAICEGCKRNMMKEVSKESMMRMQAFMFQHQNDIDALMQHEEDLNHCYFTQTPLGDMDEYHVVGVIKDNRLDMNPLIFGPSIMASYQELLSEKTKGYFDDFYDNFIDIPPELARILTDKVKPVMI